LELKLCGLSAMSLKWVPQTRGTLQRNTASVIKNWLEMIKTE